MPRGNKPTIEEIIMSSKPNKLYWHEFEDKRFFQVIHQDEEGFDVKLAPRTLMKVKYLIESNDIEGLEIIKHSSVNTERVHFSKFNFAQLKAFLEFIDSTDLGSIDENKLSLSSDLELSQQNIEKIKQLLLNEGGADVIESILAEGNITQRDIVNTSFRKKGLATFKKMLDEPEFWKEYANEQRISANSEEKVWQHFFEKNEWIFGYGLDYKYNSVLQREAALSNSELDGSNTVIGDYLMGNKRFTTFVELKKPSTVLFGNSRNRSGAWKLSNDFFDAVSQILEHKAAGTIKLEGELHNNQGELVTQKAYDSKVILVIGNWSELESASNALEKKLKAKTFELFRRDSRNIEIITYDELYERAKFIIGEEPDNSESETATDDLPF